MRGTCSSTPFISNSRDLGGKHPERFIRFCFVALSCSVEFTVASGRALHTDPNSTSINPMGPLIGEYGFLTEFVDLTPGQVLERVRKMKEEFGVREFQFYNVVGSYSRPPARSVQQWTAFFNRTITRSLLTMYVDAVKALGSRAWLYVEATGTDCGDTQLQKGATVMGIHHAGSTALFDMIMPNEAWAHKIVPQWAEFAAELGFSGIHWNTLGDIDGSAHPGYDLPGFLAASLKHLKPKSLGQTCNFVNGFGWKRELQTAGLVAFPYWSTGPRPAEEELFFKDEGMGSVFTLFPSRQNEVWPLDVILSIWLQIRCHGSAFLAIGDGSKIIQHDYLPSAVPMVEVDARRVRQALMSRTCLSPGSHNCSNLHEVVQKVLLISVEFISDLESFSILQTLKDNRGVFEQTLAAYFGFCFVRIAAEAMMPVTVHRRISNTTGRRLRQQAATPKAMEDVPATRSPHRVLVKIPFEGYGERTSQVGTGGIKTALQSSLDAARVRVGVSSAEVHSWQPARTLHQGIVIIEHSAQFAKHSLLIARGMAAVGALMAILGLCFALQSRRRRAEEHLDEVQKWTLTAEEQLTAQRESEDKLLADQESALNRNDWKARACYLSELKAKRRAEQEALMAAGQIDTLAADS